MMTHSVPSHSLSRRTPGIPSRPIALYELELNEGEAPEVSSDLKYQKPVLTDSNELGTISINGEVNRIKDIQDALASINQQNAKNKAWIIFGSVSACIAMIIGIG